MILREVLRAEPAHRGNERRRVAREIEGEAIGAPLERTRHGVRDRQHQERHGAGRQQQQRQAGHIVDAAQADRLRQRPQHDRREIEPRQQQHALEDDALPDVAVNMVRELVREHDLDLVVRVLGQHRVGHENPTGGTETRERRVRFLRLAAEAPLVRAEHARAGAVCHGQQPAAERLAFERLHGVKQRQEDDGREVGEGDDDEREQDAGFEPPPHRRLPNQPVDGADSGPAQYQADGQRLRLIAHPGSRRLRRERVAALEKVAAVETEGQAAEFVDQREEDDVTDDRGARQPER